MIRSILIFAFLFCSTLYLNAQQNQQQDTITTSSVQLPPQIDRVLRDYEKGWRDNDEKLLASLFAPDGFILSPKLLPVKGRVNIEEAYKNAGGPLYLRALTYEMEDSIAYIIGGYRSKPDGADQGKFIVTLKLLPDGIWNITGDMDNENK